MKTITKCDPRNYIASGNVVLRTASPRCRAEMSVVSSNTVINFVPEVLMSQEMQEEIISEIREFYALCRYPVVGISVVYQCNGKWVRTGVKPESINLKREYPALSNFYPVHSANGILGYNGVDILFTLLAAYRDSGGSMSNAALKKLLSSTPQDAVNSLVSYVRKIGSIYSPAGEELTEIFY